MRDPSVSYEVFDVHQHLGSAALFGIGEQSPDGAREMAARLSLMDRHGIDAACIMAPPVWPRSVSSVEVNDQVAAYRDLNRERFPVALGTANVWGGEPELRELDRLARDLRLDGVVWHHRFQGAFIDHAFMNEALQECERLRLPAFIHVVLESTQEAPWRLAELANRFPNVTFVALDALSSATHYGWIEHLARDLPNVLFDTAMVACVGRVVERLVDAVGAGRLLLGTDLYSAPANYVYPAPIHEVLYSDLSDDDRRLVLSGNVRRLFGLSTVEAEA